MRLMSPVPVKNPASSAPGIAVSCRRFLHNQLIDSVLGHGPLQAAVRARSFLEALGLLDLQAAVLSLSPTEEPT